MLTLRLVFRELIVRWRLSAVIVLTVGSAIAMHVALFTIIDGLLFRPLPYRNSARIVHLDAPLHRFASLPDRGRRVWSAAESSTQLADRCVAKVESPFQPGSAAIVDWHLRSAAVSSACFALLRIEPLIGRTLLDSDVDVRPRALVISQDLWERLGSDPTIVNRVIDLPGTLDGTRWTVVGVMPRAFNLPVATNGWYPYSRREFPDSLVPDFARLASGASIGSVREELPGVTVTPLREHVRPRETAALGFLFLGSTLLFVVASVQVASLLLSRAAERIRQFAICIALGAPRGSLRLRLLVESLVLALGALAVATLMAPPLVALIASWLPASITAGHELRLDVRGVLSASAMAAVGLALWSTLPYELLRRFDPSDLLRAGPFGTTTRQVMRARAVVVVVQITGAVALLYVAGLAFQSSIRLNQVDLGFVPAGLYAVPVPQVIAPGTDMDALRRAEQQNNELASKWLADVARIPGVQQAAFAGTWPMSPLSNLKSVTTGDGTPTRIAAVSLPIGLGYPRVLGARILAGREATPDETHARSGPEGTVVTALINRALASLVGSPGSAVGQRLLVTRQFGYRVVGVIDDVKQGRADRPTDPTIYPYIPVTSYTSMALVRLSDPARSVPRIQDLMGHTWGADRVPREITSVERIVVDATADYRARALVMAVVVIMCFPITFLAVYGSATYEVEQRTRSIAIAMAIGAPPERIARAILWRMAITALQGIAIGLGGGVLIGRFLSSRAYGVNAIEPLLAVTVSILTLIVVWAGTFLPARRASRISPAAELRRV